MLPAEQIPKDLRVKTGVDYEFLGRAMDALASPVRLGLLAWLTRPHYLEEIASHLHITRQAARKHLDRLVAVGVLERSPGERDTGPVVEYSLNPQGLFLIHDEFDKLGSLRRLEGSSALVRTKVKAASGPGARPEGPCFYVARGLNVGSCHVLRHAERGGWAIGRDPRCHVFIGHDPYASARHAEVRWQGGRFVLADLASTNGT